MFGWRLWGTFRLFSGRVGALNACGAFNFAAVPWKFARKLARPPDWFRGGGRKKEAGYASWDLVRAGGGYGLAMYGVGGVGATAGSARTRQGTLGSLDSPSAASSSDERRCETRRRRKPLPQWRSAVVSNFVSTRNVPQRSSRHHGGADRVVPCASAAGCRLSLQMHRSGLRRHHGGAGSVT